MDFTSIKKLAGQTATYGLSSILGRVLNYFLVPLYTRVFTTDQYGVVTEMYAYVAFLIIILTYGMETAFFRFSSDPGIKRTVYGTALRSILTTSAIFILITSFFSQPIADWLRYPDHNEYVIWFAIIVGMDALSTIPLAKLRQQNKAFIFVAANFVSIGLNIGLNLFFLVYCKNQYQSFGSESNWLVNTLYSPETGVGYVFISNLIASIGKILFLSPWIISRGHAFSSNTLKKMLLYGSPLLIAGLAGIVNEAIDRVMLKRLLMDLKGEMYALNQLGIYGACYKIAMIIAIFIQAFRFAADPFFFAEKGKKNAKAVYATVMHFFVIACSFIFLAIMLHIDIVMLFVGKEFREGAHIIPILLFANLCLGIYYNLSIWYKLTGATQFGAYIAIGGAIITVLLNYFLIPTLGYVGSAWATLACYFSMTIASYIIGQKMFPVKYRLEKIIGYPLLALGLYFISTQVLIGQELNKLISNALILLVFIGLVLAMERKLLDKLIK